MNVNCIYNTCVNVFAMAVNPVLVWMTFMDSGTVLSVWSLCSHVLNGCNSTGNMQYSCHYLGVIVKELVTSRVEISKIISKSGELNYWHITCCILYGCCILRVGTIFFVGRKIGLIYHFYCSAHIESTEFCVNKGAWYNLIFLLNSFLLQFLTDGILQCI